MVNHRPGAWYWRGAWLAGILFLLVSASLYLFLPVDSASGNIDAFSGDGFTVGWILQDTTTELLPGDIIQEIDGESLAYWFQPGNNQAAESQQGTLLYTVKRDDKVLQIEVTPNRLQFSKISQAVWGGVAAAILLLVVGIFLLSNPTNRQANQVLMLCCTSAAVYLFTCAFGFQASMLRNHWAFWVQLVINQLSYAGLFASTLHLVLEFFPRRIRIYWDYQRLVLILIYTFTPFILLVTFLTIPGWEEKLYWLNKAGLAAVCIQFTTTVVYILNHVLTDRNLMAYVIRKWLLFGCLFSISLAVLSFKLSGAYSLPFRAGHILVGENPTLLTSETGWLFLVLLPFYITSSISRRHFLKIDRLLMRAFVYLSALLFYALMYTGLIYLLSFLIGFWMPVFNPILVHMASMFALFILFSFSFPILRSAAEKLLCPNRLHYQSTLPELKTQLQAKLEMERLHQFMSRDVPIRLDTESASLLVLDSSQGKYMFSGNLYDAVLSSDHPLVTYLETNHKAILRFFEERELPEAIGAFFQQHQIELCIPLINHKKLVGIFNLGLKKSGTPYTLEEVALLSSLGKPGAIAVENALSYRETATRVTQMAEEVRQRTVELEHAVSVSHEERNAAQQANKVKRVFLHSVSREIRMPMNAIFGMAGLLLNTSLDEHQREFVESIRNNSDDLLEIINNILEYAIIESDKLMLEPQPFILSEFIESVLDLIGPESSRKGIDLSYVIEAHTPVMITADLARLTQILYHLLDNAIRFTEVGEINLHVQAKPYTTEKQLSFLQPDEPIYELQFSVRDTGNGIAKEQFEQIFELYHQNIDHPEGFQGGIGLGLTISKRLCELMGGKIWLESEGVPGKGSTFYFTVLVNATSDTYPAFLDVNQPQLQGKRLLLIENNDARLKILLLQIRSWSIDVIVATSTAEAFNFLKNQPEFDIALVGLESHEKEASRLADEIHQIKHAQNLPLVWLSPYQQPTSPVSVPGFVTVINKPVKPDQLYNALIQVFTSEINTRIYHPPENIIELLPEDQKVEQIPMQILLVEDNPTSQKITSLLLENLGYRVDRAGNGREALESIQRQHYDIVFMDLHMPEMNGLEATRAIREQVKTHQQPYIVALTTLDSMEERQACRTAGMDDCLLKPIKIGDLVWAIKQAQLYPVSEVKNTAIDQKNKESAAVMTPVLDLEVIQRLRKSAGNRGEQLVREVTTAYLTDAHTLLEEIQQAFNKNQTEDLHRAAHTLRSNSAAVGAAALAEISSSLESWKPLKNDQGENNTGLAEQIDRVELELNRFEAMLQSIGIEKIQ